MLEFLVTTPGGPERKVTVEADSFTSGADPNLPLHIDDGAAAEHQFSVAVRAVGVVMKDLGTAHGTKVNGQFVSQVRLEVGDVIEVGGTRIVFVLQSGREPAAPSAPVAPKVRPGPARRAAVPAARAKPRPLPASPRPPIQRRSSVVAPVVVLVLLVIGAAATYLLLNQKDPEPLTITRRTPAPAEEPAPDEPAPPPADLPDPGDLPPEEPLPPPEPDPVEPAPPAEEPAPEPAPEPPPPAIDPDEAAHRERERLVAKGRERLLRIEESLPERIRRYSLDGPMSDLVDVIETVPVGRLRESAEGLLSDLGRAQAVFARMQKSLAGGGRKIELASGLELFVTGADDEGFDAKVASAEIRKKWTELDPVTIHRVVRSDSPDAGGWLDLAAFAHLYDLPDGIDEEDLIRAFKADETMKPAIEAAIARRRGVAFPEGGFLLHDGEWVTKEEKGFLDSGLTKYDGRWLTRDEVMAAKGYVKHEGRWLSPEDYEDLLEAQREEEALAKKYLPKGLIDKPGNGDPAMEWKDAPEIKTAHYRIRTNLSREVGKDIAYTMETLRTNLKSIFGLRGKGARFTINVAANRAQYKEAWPRAGNSLGFCSTSEICTFYQPPMTTSVLMHEGTHQMVRWLCPTTPRWLHEGMATFFECSRFEFDAAKKRVGLQVGMINSMRLMSFKRETQAGRTVPLEAFMTGKGGNPYTQGWAFVYYLAKGKDGRYARKLHQFLGEAHKQDVVERFQKIFKVKDLAVFEEDWKTYILGLDPAKGVRLDAPLR